MPVAGKPFRGPHESLWVTSAGPRPDRAHRTSRINRPRSTAVGRGRNCCRHPARAKRVAPLPRADRHADCSVHAHLWPSASRSRCHRFFGPSNRMRGYSFPAMSVCFGITSACMSGCVHTLPFLGHTRMSPEVKPVSAEMMVNQGAPEPPQAGEVETVRQQPVKLAKVPPVGTEAPLVGPGGAGGDL